MAQDQFGFTEASQEAMYDFIYPDIHHWTVARQGVNEEPTVEVKEYMSDAKREVVPFAPLNREIGVGPVEDTEVREMTVILQKKIASWVGRVRTPFDLIQRAEGLETPEFVYYAGQNRAVKNLEPGRDKEVKRSSVGRATIRRQYDTTQVHYTIAKTRADSVTRGMRQLNAGQGFTAEAKIAVSEVLQ